MNTSKIFIRFAAVCGFLTVITTLGIHVYFPDPPANFEERVKLYKDNLYLVNRWWVILHCLLVIISMWAVTLLQLKKSAGTAGLGFLFIVVFAIAEITRQLFVLFYINELREQYVLSGDIVLKESLKAVISNAGLLLAPLFGLFIFSFALGNLFFGVSLTGETGFGRLLSVLLIIWSIGTFIAFGNSFWENQAIGSIIEKYNYSYQPLVRLLIAVWLWRKAASLPGK